MPTVPRFQIKKFGLGLIKPEVVQIIETLGAFKLNLLIGQQNDTRFFIFVAGLC